MQFHVKKKPVLSSQKVQVAVEAYGRYLQSISIFAAHSALLERTALLMTSSFALPGMRGKALLDTF